MSNPNPNLQAVQQAQSQNQEKSEALQLSTAANNLTAFLDKQSDALKAAIQKRMPLDFVLSTFYSAVRAQPKLMQCSPTSLLACILQSVQLDLRMDPTLGEAWMVPFENKKTRRLEAQFLVGYRGMLKRAYANSSVKSIHADLVRENDRFQYVMGTEERLIHEPVVFGDQGGIDGAYAYAHLKNGGFISAVMSLADLQKVRATSKAKDSEYGPWRTWTEEMFLKTVIRRLFKRLPNLPKEVSDMIALEEKLMAGQSQELEIESIDISTGQLPSPAPIENEPQDGFDEENAKNEVAGFSDAIKAASSQDELRKILSLVDTKLAEGKIRKEQRETLVERMATREEELAKETKPKGKKAEPDKKPEGKQGDLMEGGEKK